MKIKKDSLPIGMLSGIIAPMLAIFVFYLFSNHSMNFGEFLNHLYKHRLVSHMISIGAISNLAVFFAFLQFNLMKSARGVVMITLVYAISVAIAKFI